MDQIPFCEAVWFPGSQEISCILWKPEIHIKVPAFCRYPEPDQSSRRPPTHFLKIHHNIIVPSMPGSSKWSLSLRFPHYKPVGTYSPI
jgi:hypothetical protein